MNVSEAPPRPPSGEGEPSAVERLPRAAIAIRAAFGGVLMGLANLVPGISGGTMLLAVGIYPEFIDAVSKASTLRLRTRQMIVLFGVGGGAAIAILLLAGLLRDLVVGQRWIMYSLFIGLTLGGVPLVLRLLRPIARSGWIGAVSGFLFMVALAWAQATGAGASATDDRGQWLLLFLAGLAGASAMILPGVSGGYLLLLMGQYVPILSGIDDLRAAIVARDFGAMLAPILGVVVPVGLGVGLGLVLVSNAIKWLLAHRPQPTLGVLLGLLLGAVAGLWPFQAAVEPIPGQTVIDGRVIDAELLSDLDPADYPLEPYSPTFPEAAAAISLIVAGYLATHAISRLGGSRAREP
ncbi:MAG: DUF368 domain-containing protein [Acidobacteria bacterium]|nr:MAG: DUF368 domain-containing protein [Acidobacteriota bacterium]REK03607.1 MAG: DUF368 domain-containing protein [Acidobacteriota bacterium]